MLRKMGFRIYLDAENETIVQYEGKLGKIIFSCLEPRLLPEVVAIFPKYY